LSFTAVLYLSGPTVRFVVEPERIIVENIFNWYVVPRSRVDGIRAVDVSGVRLFLTSGDVIPIRAATSASVGSPARSVRALGRRAAELAAVVESVPPSTNSATELQRGLRRRNVLLAVLIVVGFAASAGYVFSQPSLPV
jgi:hypothetical protein